MTQILPSNEVKVNIMPLLDNHFPVIYKPVRLTGSNDVRALNPQAKKNHTCKMYLVVMISLIGTCVSGNFILITIF